MTLKILWMYPKLMDLYGDKGNITVLRYRAEKRGIAVAVESCSIGENVDVSSYDICYMGGGPDNEQELVSRDLPGRKAEIEKALDKGVFFLLICGGYQLWGKYYHNNQGKVIHGLGMADYYTVGLGQDRRCIGNIVTKCKLAGNDILLLGFENHGGETRGVDSPLGEVLTGHGNERKGRYEGYFKDRVAGTYMHGPFLAKNPEMADYIIAQGLSRRYGQVRLEGMDDCFENRAKEVMLRRLAVRTLR